MCAAAFTLAGCLSDAGSGAGDFVARLKSPDANSVARPSHAQKVNSESAIIQGLAARKSALPSGSSFERVASAVLAANSRAAESELRSARLRSEAASKNWLPKIGPSISLTSLGSLVANLVVDQVLFDNGRRKGEREFAIADVEVAAVNLAQDTNDRVHTALELYVAASEGREKAALSEASLRDMGQFEYIMSERVKGGVSDRSDLNVLRQKLAEIKADRSANIEAANTAMAELNAMSIEPLGGLHGVPALRVSSNAAQPLTVVLAEAEKTRAIAAAKIDRADQLPGLSAGGTIGEESDLGLRVSADTLLGFGTGATLRAIEEAKEAAGRRVAQANEDSNRKLRKLEGQIAAKSRQASEAAGLTRQAKRNLDLFQEQYDAGQRQVLDVVSVYETFARQQQAEVTLKYEAAQLQIDLARLLGVLADGDEI
ncbi:TolC family protein [Sulfitobacter sp. F26204]|uniref:TolC family protein n=1 Tax=Sulfitobacter sp. F26204 TaxID=2996014 RepID=UPI00225E034D|nr:TolC family protein [Sulfitobacter sp. F26204]MCX7559061.1 TolC family protein [Sulfitobacter sp. F26204]